MYRCVYKHIMSEKQMTTFNMRISKQELKKLKMFALEHDITLKDLFMKGLDWAMKEVKAEAKKKEEK